MAIRRDTTSEDVVEELDSIFDRTAAWAGSHPRQVVAGITVLLATAAALGLAHDWRERGGDQAEAEIAAVYDAYRAAMGAPAGSAEIPEPANPEIARQARAEYATQLLAAAAEHRGSAAAVGARLSAASMLEKNGDAEGAFAARKLAADDAPSGSPIAALALNRYAVGLEANGDLKAAAETYARAGKLTSPSQALALGDAARCYAALGDIQHALELFAAAEKIGADALPAHVRQRLLELRAANPQAPR